MPNKITQILLTTRNSSWGVMVNPVATNTYQHILSWESEELKDWFINKYLFNDENFDYKSKIKEMPNKPLSIISDTKCSFKVDTNDYNLSMYELRQKDLAIILEADCEFDENGKPFNYQNEKYTFWALSEISAPVGHLIQYTGELDIFFTHNIKDIFNDNEVQISRAHQDRYNEFKLPNVLKDSLNTFSEDFFNDLIEYYPVTSDILKLEEKEGSHSYLITSNTKTNFSVRIGGYNDPINLEHLYKVTIGSDNNSYYGTTPYNIIDLSSISDEKWNLFDSIPNSKRVSFLNSIFSHNPAAYAGIITLPFKLKQSNTQYYFSATIERVKDYDWEKDLSIKLLFEKMIGTSRNSYKFDFDEIFKGFNFTELSDLNKNFNYLNEGKIYHSTINNLRAIDVIGSTYNFPYSKLVNTSHFYIEMGVALNTLGVYYKINLSNLNSIINNYNYGLEGEWGFQQDKTINNWDEYQTYNRAQFNNSMKIAKRHETQSKITGSIGILGGLADGVTSIASMALSGGAVGSGGLMDSITQVNTGANEIANAKDELNSLIAQQEDMINSPPSITNGSPMIYSLLHSILSSTSETVYNTKKELMQIFVMRPQEIVREKIAWLFHISGVNLASTFHNINKLINNRYYFNYIKTSMSVFENMKIELSQNVRNIIDKSMINGLTIWHIRDKETFKGIKNYNINNVEMSLLDGN